jgi:HNH endonuclease
MCRPSAAYCTELGTDPIRWSSVAPLMPPPWFESQVFLFRDAVCAAAAGEVEQARVSLATIRSAELRTWFCEHGQWSGVHRARLLQRNAVAFAGELDILRAPLKYEREVFERDNYCCRYCSLPTVAKRVLLAFEKIVGSDVFRNVGRNAEQHGVVHGFKVVADHVVAFKRGGRTNLENLVTACPACNYGKDQYSVEQLGISDPRLRPPRALEWDGLTGFLPQLTDRSKALTKSNVPI